MNTGNQRRFWRWRRQPISTHPAFLVCPLCGSNPAPTPSFSPAAQILQHKENSQRLPPCMWTFQSVWLISDEMGIAANATLSRNVVTRGPEDAHSPFHFQTETGLKGEMTVLRSKVKDSKTTMVYFPNLTPNFMTLAQLFARGEEKIHFCIALIFKFAPLVPACQSADSLQLHSPLVFAKHFVVCRSGHCTAWGRWFIFIYGWAQLGSGSPASLPQSASWQVAELEPQSRSDVQPVGASHHHRTKAAHCFTPVPSARWDAKAGSQLTDAQTHPSWQLGKSSQLHKQSLAFKSTFP